MTQGVEAHVTVRMPARLTARLKSWASVGRIQMSCARRQTRHVECRSTPVALDLRLVVLEGVDPATGR
jgi:hypothetical protein